MSIFNSNNGDAYSGGIIFGKTSQLGFARIVFRNVTTFGMNNRKSLEGSIVHLTVKADV